MSLPSNCSISHSLVCSVCDPSVSAAFIYPALLSRLYICLFFGLKLSFSSGAHTHNSQDRVSFTLLYPVSLVLLLPLLFLLLCQLYSELIFSLSFANVCVLFDLFTLLCLSLTSYLRASRTRVMPNVGTSLCVPTLFSVIILLVYFSIREQSNLSLICTHTHNLLLSPSYVCVAFAPFRKVNATAAT